jgi:hypothetical protein
MAQALTLKRNVRTKLKPAIKKIKIADWDSYLYSLWKQNMTLNPGLCDDAKKSHIHCECSYGCTRTILEIPQKKERRHIRDVHRI